MREIESKNFQVLSRNELRSISGGINSEFKDSCFNRPEDCQSRPGDYCGSHMCRVNPYTTVRVRSCTYSPEPNP